MRAIKDTGPDGEPPVGPLAREQDHVEDDRAPFGGGRVETGDIRERFEHQRTPPAKAASAERNSILPGPGDPQFMPARHDARLIANAAHVGEIHQITGVGPEEVPALELDLHLLQSARDGDDPVDGVDLEAVLHRFHVDHIGDVDP